MAFLIDTDPKPFTVVVNAIITGFGDPFSFLSIQSLGFSILDLAKFLNYNDVFLWLYIQSYVRFCFCISLNLTFCMKIYKYDYHGFLYFEYSVKIEISR